MKKEYNRQNMRFKKSKKNISPQKNLQGFLPGDLFFTSYQYLLAETGVL